MNTTDITLGMDASTMTQLSKCINTGVGPVVLREADGKPMGTVTRSADGRNLLIQGERLKSKGGIYLVIDRLKGTRDVGALVLGLILFGRVLPVSALGPNGMLFNPAEEGEHTEFLAPPKERVASKSKPAPGGKRKATVK